MCAFDLCLCYVSQISMLKQIKHLVPGGFSSYQRHLQKYEVRLFFRNCKETNYFLNGQEYSEAFQTFSKVSKILKEAHFDNVLGKKVWLNLD